MGYGAAAAVFAVDSARISQPYAPGGTVSWTTYTYDGLGRTISVTLPHGSVTTYAYAGNTVTVTDPAGKWKKHSGADLDKFFNGAAGRMNLQKGPCFIGLNNG